MQLGQDMKSLLYGCEDDQTHLHSWTGGKKRRVLCAAKDPCTKRGAVFAGLVDASTEVPFATTDQDPKRIFSGKYVKKSRKRHVHDKVGASRLFDPEVYLTNYERSLSNRKSSSLRNFAGNGDILTHDIRTVAKRRSKGEVPEDKPEESSDADTAASVKREAADPQTNAASTSGGA